MQESKKILGPLQMPEELLQRVGGMAETGGKQMGIGKDDLIRMEGDDLIRMEDGGRLSDPAD